MKDYDLKGIIVEGNKAVIAVALPEPKNEDDYKIFNLYNISDSKGNKLLIHFKDPLGHPLKHQGNYVMFKIDLSSAILLDSSIIPFDFKNKIEVVLCHENKDDLSEKPIDIYNRTRSESASIEVKQKDIFGPNLTGTGIIRPN